MVSNGMKPPKVENLPIEREFAQVVLEECGLGEWRQIVRQAVQRAKAGDPDAREWLSDLIFPEGAPSPLTVSAAVAAGRAPVFDIAEVAKRDLEEMALVTIRAGQGGT